MSSPEVRPALDAFMDLPLEDVRAFGTASTLVRGHLEQSEGVLVEPLRGSLPLEWAASGLEDVEASPTAGLHTIRVPSGVGMHVRSDTGEARFGRLYREIRKNIVRHGLADIPEGAAGITILDEVQLGGTVTRIANICVGYARDHAIPLPVRIIAAEDSSAVERQRPRYRSLVAGEDPNIRVVPVRMPLIGVDNRELLPEVTYTYDYTDRGRELSGISVADNPEAEILFRAIGSLSRNPALASEGRYISGLVDRLRTDHSRREVSAWAETFAGTFSQ